MSNNEIERATKNIEGAIRTIARQKGLDVESGLSLVELGAAVGVEVVYSDTGIPSIHHSTQWTR
jgi:hypothetical protein